MTTQVDNANTCEIKLGRSRILKQKTKINKFIKYEKLVERIKSRNLFKLIVIEEKVNLLLRKKEEIKPKEKPIKFEKIFPNP